MLGALRGSSPLFVVATLAACMSPACGDEPTVTGVAGGAGGAAPAQTASSTTAASSGVGSGGDAPSRSWIEVPDAHDGDCEVAVLAPESLAMLSPRAWEPCGAGCEITAATRSPYQPIADRVTSNGGTLAGTALAQVVTGTVDQTMYIRELLDLAGGTPVMLLRHRATCGALGGHWSPQLVTFRKLGENDPAFHLGIADLVSGALSWVEPPWTGISGASLVPFVYGDGVGLLRGFASLSVTSGFESSALTTIFSSSKWQRSVSARGDQIVWVNWDSGTGVASGWQTGGSVTTLFDPPDRHVVDVAISPSRVVWLSATGNASGAAEGIYESLGVEHAPRPATFAAEVVPTAPRLELPSHRSVPEVATHGDTATFLQGCGMDGNKEFPCAVVVDLAAMNAWYVPPRPGRAYSKLLAVDGDHVYLAETEANTAASVFDRIVRYDLDVIKSGAGPQL